MMKTMEMLKVNTEQYKYVVIFTSDSISISDADLLSTYLHSEHCLNGKVLLDLLLVNGNAFNRFVEVDFDGQKVQKNSYNIVMNVSPEIKNNTAAFLRRNKQYLQHCILTNSEKGDILFQRS